MKVLLMEICQVQVSAGSLAEAETLASAAVTARLAACAQITGPIRSVYRWQGAVENAEEWLVTFKTRLELFAQLESQVREIHSYDTPEIICLPVIRSSQAYAAWVEESTLKHY
jgi:periplasmic divalent cation tolerance protein